MFVWDKGKQVYNTLTKGESTVESTNRIVAVATVRETVKKRVKGAGIVAW